MSTTTKTSVAGSSDRFPVEVVAISVVAAVLLIVVLICAVCCGISRREQHPYKRHDDKNNAYVSRTLTPTSSTQVEDGPVDPTQTNIQYVDFPSDGEEGIVNSAVVVKSEDTRTDFTLVDEVVAGDEEVDIEGMYATVNKSSVRSKRPYVNMADVDQSESAPDLADQSESAPDLADQSESAPDLADQAESAPDLADQSESAPDLADQSESAPDLAEQSEMSVYGVDSIKNENASVSFLSI
ncbi:uncharacterized protein LOC121390054 [Gigantopelta aegis]|uniref:uncharacterized protein LOC121390054 n=1 Tax=Gigantopelta aegis TaxID=1735272 RepID=UPI001B88CF35|nr:uncharacterized protein LOC121390054 [Gigantopelta aegis]